MSVVSEPGAQTPVPRWQTTSLEALRHRDFRRFWIAAIISNSGTWMQQLAVPFVIFQLTESNTWLGVAAFAGLVPTVPMSPIAGVIADRIDRRKVIIASQCAQLLTALALWALWVTGEVTPVRMIIVLAISGVSGGLQIASWQSIVPMLVPRESLVAAVQLNSTQFTAARAFGPAIGGLVLAWFGPGGAFLGNAGSYLFTIVAVATVNPRTVELAPSHVSPLQQFKDGLRYVRERPNMVFAVCTGFAIAVFGQAVVWVAAGLADEVFEVDEKGLGVLTACVGLGSIVASSIVIGRGSRGRRSRQARAGLGLYGVGVIVAGSTDLFVVGLVGFFLLGVSHILVAVALNTTIQIQVAEEVRGRVLSIYVMSLLIGLPVGSLIIGSLGDLIGLQATLVTSGLLLIGYFAAAMLVFDRFRSLDADHDVTLDSAG